MASAHPIYGASLLLAYGVGHCAVIVLAGTFTEVVQRYLDWNEQFKGVKVLKVACGVLVLLGGGYLIYTAH
jgi:cytochrome c-type biogenesis protein